MKHLLLPLCSLLIAAGCQEDEDERYDTGYSDGYAEGYNTTCKIRATLVEGDWDSPAYSKGYRAGRVDGANACLSGRKD